MKYWRKVFHVANIGAILLSFAMMFQYPQLLYLGLGLCVVGACDLLTYENEETKAREDEQ